jgi:hypothetical protein
MEAVPGCSRAGCTAVGTKKSILSYREKTIILNVYNPLEKDHPMKLKTGLVEMCSRYTGVSELSVFKILREKKIEGDVKKPKKGGGKKKLILNEDEKNAVWRTVHKS